MEYAPRVCHTCKARKKRCDKALPRCGYCTARDLACSYEMHPESRDQQHQNTCSHAVSLLFDPRLMPATTATTLDEILKIHVHHVHMLTKLHVQDINKRFFPNFYRWLPVLSPAIFNKSLATYEEQSSSSSPLADFSLLLLALYLITWRQSDRGAANFSPESLYMTVRTLFGQVQATICASTTLLQAGLLIAAYDYACGRPHSAYILMGTCVRMALALGLDRVGRNTDQNETKAREQYMVWCALVVLERHIQCEIQQRQVVSHEAPLSYETHSLQVNDNEESFTDATALTVTSFTCFRRLAYVSNVLDQILCIIAQPEQGILIKIRKLIKLDRELQVILAMLTKDSRHEWSFSCSAIGTAVRSLFTLHKYILSQCYLVDGNDMIYIQQNSSSALTTATKMMVDVAQDHLRRVTPETVDKLPLSCLYNLRSAVENIRDRNHLIGTAVENSLLAEDMESLVALDTMITDRWSG